MKQGEAHMFYFENPLRFAPFSSIPFLYRLSFFFLAY
jgi:hypothetical protein